MRRFRTRYASLGSRCRRRRTAGRPRFGGRPAVQSSYHASTELRCEDQEQPAIPHLSTSSLSASVSFVLPAGESTMTHVSDRRTCCRERRGQTAGAAARKRAAAPAIPTFSADQTTCRSSCDQGGRPELSRERHELRPCTSADSAFHGSCGSLRPENSGERHEPSGRTRRWRARPHASPTLV